MDHIAQFRVLDPHKYKHCLENCSKRTILDTLNIRTEHLSKLRYNQKSFHFLHVH